MLAHIPLNQAHHPVASAGLPDNPIVINKDVATNFLKSFIMISPLYFKHPPHILLKNRVGLFIITTITCGVNCQFQFFYSIPYFYSSFSFLYPSSVGLSFPFNHPREYPVAFKSTSFKDSPLNR